MKVFKYNRQNKVSQRIEMKTSTISKSQSKSLKKQIRGGSQAFEKSKSMQKKSFVPFQMLNNFAMSRESAINNGLIDLENTQNQKNLIQKLRQKVSKQKQKETRRKLMSAQPNKKVKNFIGTKLQKRLQSYYLFLALIRQTLNTPVCKPLQQNKKFTVFIGKGNNSKLVKKLFYSRHWWTVTNDPKDLNINLIWTQWSKKSIFNLLQEQEPNNSQNKINKIICQQQPKKTIIFNQYNYILKTKQRDTTKSTFVQTDNDVRTYLTTIKQQKKKKSISITCNHVEGHQKITDKKNLLYSLQSYCTQNKLNCFQILPLSFHINGSQQQFNTLQVIQKQLSEQEKRIMWICKPGEKSNRGNGIRVFKKINQIQEHLQKQSQKYPNRTYIIQQYIYPALFHRRKFDIRCFVLLVASPHISAYFFNDGYLRTSSKQFKDKKSDDKFMHLTNDAIQKKASDYGKFQKGNKVTFEEYQNYLDMFQKRQINFKKDILPKLKSMAAKAIAAGSQGFNQFTRSYSFQLLGYDFMLDQNYKPWLIQVNTNPCIQTGCPVLASFIPSAVNNALKLAVDSVFKPPKVNDWHLQQVMTFPQKMLQQNKYQLIFQETIL